MAIGEEGLRQALDAQEANGGFLTVGFNRRFFPLIQEMKAFFAPGQPPAIEYPD